MPNQSRKRFDSCSDSEGAATSARNPPSTYAEAVATQGDAQQVPSLPLATCKSGGGWGVGPFNTFLASHDDQPRSRTSAHQPATCEQSTSTTSPEPGNGGREGSTSHRSTHTRVGGADEDEFLFTGDDMPVKDCYIPPCQDNGEDDKDTFVDKGSAAAFELPAESAAALSGGTPNPTATAQTSSTKRASKVRPAVTVHGPPASSPQPGGAAASSSPPVSGGNGNGRGTGGTAVVSSNAAVAVSGAPSSSPAAAGPSNVSGALVKSTGASLITAPTSASSPLAASISVSPGWRQARLSVNPSNVVLSHSSPVRRGNGSKVLNNGLAGLSQYARTNSSEIAPGVVYRAFLPVRAMAMDPEQPALWAAVGDDPLITLRVDGNELAHSRSVKDIEQIYCMAVVRIAEEHGTTFKSASVSPRTALGTPKTTTLKPGRRGKKASRRNASSRKAGKGGTSPGSQVLSKSTTSCDGGDDGDSSSVDGDIEGMLCSPSAGGGSREKPRFSNFLWCGLSRGHVAVVNMATLEYQIIHNAHTQTINKIWYWEGRNKVWTAGREKGVHVWDPQRRVVLKKRNIAAILEDATYVEGADKVFAVAGDPCVRVFEPSGENVNVPKGQENRIKMKSDASVIQYHRHSGLIWVGLARGSVLMNPISMEVERTLPYTFNAILFEGDKAIIAGQEGPNGDGRLMVLDITSPRNPTVVAYCKFLNPLPLGIHIIPHSRFAVAAQDDPKKGIVVAVFVYDGTAAIPHAVNGKYPEQRTEKVVRAAVTSSAAITSPAQSTQQPLAITEAPTPAPMIATSTTVSATAVSPPPPPAETNVSNMHAVGPSPATTITNTNTNNTADKALLHRTAVVKYAPDPRLERKFGVEADHASLVEAIGPETQEIKTALKHLVKTTDEVRYTLLHERPAQSTLADFSCLLRSRQQWLLEQGSITSLPELPPPVTERINRDYVTVEGKTVATSVEQLQVMYNRAIAKLQQYQQQARPEPGSAQPSSLHSSPAAPAAVSNTAPSLSSPTGFGYGLGERNVNGALDSGRVAGSDGQRNLSSVENDALQAPPVTSTRSGSSGESAMLPPWATQLASTLQRERMLHEQQLSALQLKVEHLTERNAALSNGFARLQAHVAALGQQGLASVFEADSTDSTTILDNEESSAPTALLRTHHHGSQRQGRSLLSPQQQAAATALFVQLSRGKTHKPKHVRNSTELLVTAIDEVVHLAHLRASRSSERDPLGGTAVMQHSGSVPPGSVVDDCASGSPDTRHSLSQGPRYRGPGSPGSSSPPANAPLDFMRGKSAGGTVENDKDYQSSAAVQIGSEATESGLDNRSVLIDRPVTSLRNACAMVEVELGNLHELNSEVMSFWSRLQSSPSPHRPGPASDSATESSVKAIDKGLLLSLSPSDREASPTLVHLMAARVLLAACWAECGQTVLRELTNVGGLESPFAAGCVHNALVSTRATDACIAAGSDAAEDWWHQGPLEVLDYESADEKATVLAKASQFSASNTLELSNFSRIRETLQVRCSASTEPQCGVSASQFMLHRLPGALAWSHTSLRLLFTLLETAEETLSSAGEAAARGDGPGKKKDARKGSSRKTSPSAGGTEANGSKDTATRTASAIGVAMTHWALFLSNLRAELVAMHHAVRLYHAWHFGTPAATTAPTNQASKTKSVGGAAGVAREKPKVAASHSAPAVSESLADSAAALSSKGKLLLLYMQWCFPAIGCLSEANAAGATANSTAAPPASASIAIPPFFTPDEENDAACAMTVQRTTSECGNMLAELVGETAQLLQRVALLLSYCQALRARSLTALQGGHDSAVARIAESVGGADHIDCEARIPAESEKAFLRS